VAEGLVVRRSIRSDRRAFIIRLTPKGKRQFDAMAAEHETWIDALLSDLTLGQRQGLHESIAQLRATVVAQLAAQGATDD
jgi:DNA-binding MarR family transcriptional regulator